MDKKSLFTIIAVPISFISGYLVHSAITKRANNRLKGDLYLISDETGEYTQPFLVPNVELKDIAKDNTILLRVSKISEKELVSRKRNNY